MLFIDIELNSVRIDVNSISLMSNVVSYLRFCGPWFAIYS
jgi:hypothetical protein